MEEIVVIEETEVPVEEAPAERAPVEVAPEEGVSVEVAPEEGVSVDKTPAEVSAVLEVAEVPVVETETELIERF